MEQISGRRWQSPRIDGGVEFGVALLQETCCTNCCCVACSGAAVVDCGWSEALPRSRLSRRLEWPNRSEYRSCDIIGLATSPQSKNNSLTRLSTPPIWDCGRGSSVSVSNQVPCALKPSAVIDPFPLAQLVVPAVRRCPVDGSTPPPKSFYANRIWPSH